jgi:hypothetical protein
MSPVKFDGNYSSDISSPMLVFGGTKANLGVLVVPVYVENVSWMYIGGAAIIVGNVTIYHTYNYCPAGNLYEKCSLIYLSIFSIISLNGVIFTTVDSNFTSCNPVLMVRSVGNTVYLRECVFSNMTMVETPVIFNYMDGVLNAESCIFRFVLLLFFLFSYSFFFFFWFHLHFHQ